MSNPINLEELKSKQRDLLLAEMAALLHDMGKCTDEHIINQASDKPNGYTYRSKTAQSQLLPPDLPCINLFGDSVLFRDLMEKGMPRAIKKQSIPWIVRVLGRCHSVAHVEKELGDEDKATKQLKNNTRSSSAYGFEGEAISGLTRRLHSLPFSELTKRDLFALKVGRVFDYALGDTRHPVNEVTLTNWSDAVAALYKSALAGGLLGVKPEPDHLCWRILRINFDMLGLYARAIKIADLLGYQKIVDDACERVKQLLEVEYPLGNEVYRDTTGIYFTFPDISLPAEFERLIKNCVTAVDQELAPRIAITEGDGATAVEQLKGILAKSHGEARQALAQPFDSQNYSPYWQELWTGQQEGKEREICPICRLRPMGEGREKGCSDCLERRRSRILNWQENPGHTIWMDEIADHNGRVALLVGKFGLDDWLSGEMVQTMLVRAVPDNTGACRSKNPSPARLRRVWETCLRFWAETVENGILGGYEYGNDTEQAHLRSHRRLIFPDTKSSWKENVAHDGLVGGKPISLLWLSALECFVTISNLQLAGELREGQKITVGDPDRPRKTFTFTAQKVHQPDGGMTAYKPFLPLLTSPDQFLALVPAADALEIAKRIREAYMLHFGKVQNRLPLFLGSVFFQRKLPLPAAIDTGRRMLDGWNPEDEAWVVQCKNITADQQILKLHLARNGQTIAYDIPIKMGDGATEDIWYPYFRLVHNATSSRKFCFKKVREVEVSNGDGDSGVEESDNEELWVHAADLRCGDRVFLRPSRFAYTFLEKTSQRFRFDPHQEMLLMDELPGLMEMWNKLKEMPEMTDTRLRGIQALFEDKLRLWGPDNEQVAEHNENRDPFQRLVKTTFQRERITDIKIEEVLDGSFQRCLEIYLHILKQRIKKEARDD